MLIKKYDFYKFDYEHSFFIDFSFKDDSYSITCFLKALFPSESAIWFKNEFQKSENFLVVGMFSDVEVTIDFRSNLVYISDASENDYRFREKNITSLKIVEQCLQGNLYYNVLNKDNFIHLIKSWTNLLENQPNFALLYLDDQNWYDVVPFDSQEAMEKFVADHTKIEDPK